MDAQTENKLLKAYHVFDATGNHDEDEIIFETTSGRAKTHSELHGWIEFTKIGVRRTPQFDAFSEQGYVPKEKLLEDGWWFECWGNKCFRRITGDDEHVVINEHVYCSECAKEGGLVMDAQKEFFLKQIEQLHQNNKIRDSQDYMNYIGNNYEFLIQLVREQETQLAKYERVVRAARQLRETFPTCKEWSSQQINLNFALNDLMEPA